MYRAAIKFRFKASVSATTTLVLVQTAYGNEAVNRSNIFRRYSWFRYGRELVEMTREVAAQNQLELTKQWCCCWFGKKWLSSRITNDSRIFEHPQVLVLWIVKVDFGKTNLCARFVPRSLTADQREDRVTSCQDMIAMADEFKIFFNKITTENETW
jgi:hypothetical protein